MEKLGLLYFVFYNNIILCQKFRFTFFCSTIQQHLQLYHNYKDPRLQKVMVEIYSKFLAMHWENMVTPANRLAPVTSLEITPGFQYNIFCCNFEAGEQSQNYCTIVQYMKKKHQLPQKNNSMIKNVGFQLFFPALSKKLFSMVLSGSRTTSITYLSSTVESSQRFLKHLKLEHKKFDAIQQASFSIYAI